MTTSFDLSVGAVSQALSRRAGPHLQQYLSARCEELGSAFDPHGQIVESPGYKLQCSQLFHIFCQPYDMKGSSGTATKVWISLNRKKTHYLTIVAVQNT